MSFKSPKPTNHNPSKAKDGSPAIVRPQVGHKLLEELGDEGYAHLGKFTCCCLVLMTFLSFPGLLPYIALSFWEFPKIGVPYFGVLIIRRILLFRVPY